MIPAEQTVRSLLALKLIRKERKNHVIDLVFDEGIALFAGLNVVPKRSCLAAYSSRVGHQTNSIIMGWKSAPRAASRMLDRQLFKSSEDEEMKTIGMLCGWPGGSMAVLEKRSRRHSLAARTDYQGVF